MRIGKDFRNHLICASHFINEGTEAQRGSMTFIRSCRLLMAKLKQLPRIPGPHSSPGYITPRYFFYISKTVSIIMEQHVCT